jgi:hypothetical protein
VKEANDRLVFSVSPNLSKLVDKVDLRFVNNTFRDLPRRAKLYPHLLFKQISSLRVGPLITHKVGLCGVDDEEIMAACTHFIDVQELEPPAGEESESPRPRADTMPRAASAQGLYRAPAFGRRGQRNVPINMLPMFESPEAQRSRQRDRISGHLRAMRPRQSGD